MEIFFCILCNMVLILILVVLYKIIRKIIIGYCYFKNWSIGLGIIGCWYWFCIWWNMIWRIFGLNIIFNNYFFNFFKVFNSYCVSNVELNCILNVLDKVNLLLIDLFFIYSFKLDLELVFFEFRLKVYVKFWFFFVIVIVFDVCIWWYKMDIIRKNLIIKEYKK